jgi:hypothetical protein
MNTRLADCSLEMSVAYRQSGTAAYFCMQLEQFSSNYVIHCQMLMHLDWKRHPNAAIYVIPVLSTSCAVTSLWHCRRLLTSRVFIVRALRKRLVTVGFSWHPWTLSWERVVGNVVTWFKKLLGRTAVRPTQQCSELKTGTLLVFWCGLRFANTSWLLTEVLACLSLSNTFFVWFYSPCLKFLNYLFKTPVKIYYGSCRKSARCCTL